jgi:hypothetical protein
MKNPLILASLTALSLSGLAQSSLSSLSPVTISLENATPSALIFSPFRHFEVIDERPDTARIGIHTFVPTVGIPRDRQLVFHRPAAAEIADYLNGHFARPDAPYTALVILRNLWLSDAAYHHNEKEKNPGFHHERTHIRLKAEIYAVRDSLFMPVLRFDTLQAYKRDNPYTNVSTYYNLWDRDLTGLLNHMTDSAARLTLAKKDHSRLIHLEDIRQYNQSRFNVPITGNTDLLPGVYASFSEFRENAPSIHNFEVRQEKGNRLLYIRETGGASWYSHDAWGYCDGKTIYIMRDGILYPLWKEGKAFYFYSQAFKEIDMDSGEIY